MPMTGDFSALKSIQQKLIATKVVPFKVATMVAPQLQTTIDSTFGAQANVYGDPWKPINPKSYARGTKSPGVRTGALRGSIRVTPEGAKLRVPLGQDYGKYMIAAGRSPYPKGRLPPSWQPLIDEAVQKAFREALGS